MKISKKGSVAAALLAVAFFSLNLTSTSNYQGGISITETTSEYLTPLGGKEIKITKGFNFNFDKNIHDSLEFTKRNSSK